METHIFILVFSLIINLTSAKFSLISASYSVLKQGSHLSVHDILVSPNETFSAGFFPVGENAYCFSIWFSKPSCNISDDCTIVWMANRDFPVNGKNSRLWLQETGNLVLTDGGDKSTPWSTGSVSLSSTTELILYDTGNLVLQNLQGVVLWQSFDSPTDTLLPLQRFTRDTQLVSSRSRTNFSSGFYKLLFNNDNLLRLLYDGPEDSSIYWPSPWLVGWAIHGRSAYNSSRFAFLDNLGKFTSSDEFSFLAADYGVRLQRRLTIDFDGNLRLYSRKQNSTNWVVSFQALPQPCQIHGLCGANSFCFYEPTDTVSSIKCSCLPGYKVKNSTDWSYGCEPEFKNFSCEDNNTTDQHQAGFIKLPHVEFYGYDYQLFPGYTLEMCENKCLSLCNCKGFQYRYIGKGLWNLFSAMNNINPDVNPVVCYIKMALLNGRRSGSFDGDFHLKVPKSSLFSDKQVVSGSGLYCSSEELVRPIDRTYPESNQNEKLQLLLWFGIVIGVVEIIVTLFVWCFLNSSHHQDSNYEADTRGYHHIAGFKRFTYYELRKATENFSLEIGRGAGGIVYKGTLSDNRIAAIKRLNITDQGEAEFLAEVSIIGKLNHMNLIEMWGYCAEKRHRLLVYKYMENGSLSENLSSKALDWRKRFQIAIGTARGLAYLHEECLDWVLHCDVKPQNILLDSNYQPKVSDFGLSKLLNRDDMKNSSFSRIRGTRGYMAPEWVFNLPITSKVDVYSYGIVVLEMVTGKSPTMGVSSRTTTRTEETEEKQRLLVAWVREKINGGDESWIKEIVDPKMVGDYDRSEVEIVVKLALQCVEEDRDSRPTMSKVVEILLHRLEHYL